MCSITKPNMKRLTEEMVIARTKISDLGTIKRLNCWGSELTDVSLLRRMSRVEVLSLSINKIESLSDFQHCKDLQELYVRQNNIKDLNEVCYLQDLPNLKILMLGENPCASEDGYRLSVIRALPNLEKLDNVSVTPEEVTDANKRGTILIHPDDQFQSAVQPDYYTGRTNNPVAHSPPRSHEISPVRHEPLRQNSCDPDEDQDYTNDVDDPVERPINISPSGQKKIAQVNGAKTSDIVDQESPPRRYQEYQDQRRLYSPENEVSAPPVPNTMKMYEDRRNANSYENESPRQSRHYPQYDRSPTSSTNNTDENGITPDSPKEERLPYSTSVNSIKEYTNGDRYQTYTQPPSSNRHSEGSDGSSNGQPGYDQGFMKQKEPRDRGDRCDRPACGASHRPPFNRRPVTRNSNILSATLCLIKELDYPSLEVVDMAVRCRMDELEY